MARLVALGIDGGTLDIIEPMVKAGELPTFKKLMDKGSYGILESLAPPVTCPLWKSYSTGKNYGKLGAYSWIDVLCKEKRMRVNTSKRFRKYREIWDYLEEAGNTCGVINMSLSFPPKKVKGFFISGNVHKPEYNYTYPIELKKEITEKFGYKISKSSLNLAERSPAVIKETMEVIKSRFDVAKAKVNDVDFMQVLLYRTDAVMHFHWDSDFMRDVYRLMDRGLGELMKAAGKDCNLMVISDHGFRKMDWFFYSNNWLKEKGWLVERKGSGEVFNRLGISRDMLFCLASRFRMVWLLKKLVPKAVSKTIKSAQRGIGGADAMYLIDWNKSKVVSQSAGSFYINREGKEKEQLLDQLERELVALRNPNTDKKVIDRTFRKKDIFSGPFVDIAPDLVALPGEATEINGSLGKSEIFWNKHHWQATHAMDGMFLFYGPDFRKGGYNGRASLLDIMPTILHVMGAAVPKDVDGKVLQDFFAEGSEAKRRKVAFREPLAEIDNTVETSQQDSLVR